MNYTVEKIEDGKKAKFSFKLDAAEWEKDINGAYEKNKGKYALDGFRKGHVPRKILERYYGEGLFFEDAFNDNFPKYYSEALEKETWAEPVDRPEIDISSIDEKGISFTATVVLKPEVKLGAYTGLKIKKTDYPVTDKDVENELEKAREKGARFIDVTDRAVENGDMINLDYSGSVDGVKFDGGTAKGQTLEIGSGSFIPGFEEQIVGKNIGENFDITVKFPENYHAEDLKGKEAVFNITVNEIKTKQLPSLDDDFAKDVSEFDTLEDYKKDIESKLKESSEKRAQTENENNIMDAIVANAEVDIPECMIEDELNGMLKDFEYRLMYQGLKLEDYFKYLNITADDFKKDRREDALRAVKTRLVTEAILKAEKIDCDDESLEKLYVETAAKNNKDISDFKKSLTERHVAYYKDQVVLEKLLNFIKEKNILE